MNQDYSPLLSVSPSCSSQDDLDKDEEQSFSTSHTVVKRSAWRRRLEILAFLASLLINCVFFASHISNPSSKQLRFHDELMQRIAEPIYSPAQSAIKYERRTFAKLGVLSKFHGPPTDETDEAWNSLYPVGISRVTKAEASKMANWTERIPGDDHYVISLDVFHQLHCLNLVRKALWPDRYGPQELGDPVLEDDDTPFDHVDHCVNIIRENIICNADTTPNVFQWSEEKNMIFPHFDSVHMCRNWESITEWVNEHQLLTPWNAKLRPSRLDTNSRI